MFDPRVALYATRISDPTPIGIGRYFAEIVPALAETPMGDRYDLVASREPDGDGRPSWLPDQTPLKRVPVNRKALHALWTATSFPRLERWLGEPAALVHVLHAFVRVPTRSPLVYTIHDLLPLRLPDWYGRKERWMFNRAVQHAADEAAAIVTDSETVAAEVRSEFGIEPGRVVAIPCGVRARPRPTSDVIDAVCASHGVRPGHFAVAVGEVNGRKDLPTVVRALANVRDLDLVVVGKRGRGAESLDRALEGSGVDRRVRLLGFRPDAEVAALVAGARALVHPSVFEGFGFTPLEAMAEGTPAIVSDGGSLPEVVGDAAIVAPSGDADAWADALTRLATDDDLFDAYRDRGLARARRFTWPAAAAALALLHTSLLR